MKEDPRLDRAKPSEAPRADAVPSGSKAPKAVEGQVGPLEPIQGLAKAALHGASAPEPETAAGGSKNAAPLLVGLGSTPASTDESLAKPAGLELAPVGHSPDGSSLAALNAVPRTAADAPPAAVPAAPLNPAPTPSAPVLQVEGGLRWMLKGGAQEAQLQLHPDSLGQVTIHLRVEGGEVHARLWVTEPASVQAVRDGRPHLEMSLKEQGLQLGSFDLQQGHRPFQEAPSAPAYRESASVNPIPARQEAPAAPLPSILNAHHVELYA